MASLTVCETHSPLEDAQILRKACEGWGTNEKAIIEVICHRNATQRQLIMKAYEETYHENLIKRLESELSGDFERAMYRWILDPADRGAVLAHVALTKGSPHYEVIVEIACTYSPEELLEIRRAYKIRYKHSLEEDVAIHSSGDIRKLLVALVSAYRYDGSEINAGLSKSEASIILEAVNNKKYNDDELLRILSTRSMTQIMAILNQYRENLGSSITKGLLEGDQSTEYLSLLSATIQCLINPVKYYEKVVRNAVKGFGTNEDALTRVIVSRAEKDLELIKERYYKQNSVTLHHAVVSDTSGDYKRLLLALIGDEPAK